MNNLNSILDYLKVFNNINKRKPYEPRTMAQGGRIGLKPGGIVEPGVEYYGKFTEAEKKANIKTWMDNTGSTLEDYNKKSYHNKRYIRQGVVTGIKQTGEFGKKLEGTATKQFRNWLSKQDPKTLTADSVEDLIKQSKIKITSQTRSGTRPGLVHAISRIMEEKEFAKFKNIQLGRTYPSEQLDEFADAILDAYAKDDITKIVDPKYKSNINRAKINKYDNLDNLVKKTGLDEETIFNLFDDREAYIELDLSEEFRTGRPVEKGKAKFYKQAENWIVKNSKRYADPDKFKKAFVRTFGKNNDIIQKINSPNKRMQMSVPFSDWFRSNIMGSSEQALRGQVKPGYSSTQLDSIFKTAIYTNNENVRNKIINELTNILPEKGSKRIPDIREKFRNSPILKKFGLNQKIDGPIARLLAKEVGDDLLKQVSLFRKPWLGTSELLTYLKDRVNPKYKSMFEETSKAVKYAQKNQWPEAKKALNISESIMFDHKIPKALMELGYADDIEYIKVTPTSKEFNAKIKRIQFDMPMIDLTKEWEKAKTVDAKSKVVGEMNTLKDNFSKKYGNYLDDVKINVDKTGKPIFSSTADVVTKKTDLVKSLETGLQHEKFPTMNKKQQHKFLKEAGFNIDKCLSSGGRVGFGVGGGVNTCIRGVIEAEQQKAMKTKNFGKFTKFGKFARTAGWFLGPIDIPVELAFALPHMLQGDKEAAKRATTFGLFGWGKDKREEVKESSPEAYKYIKHVEDTADYVDTWFKNQDLHEEKKLLLEEQANVPEDRKELFSGALEKQREDLENQIMDTEEVMNQIHAGYKGYESIYEAAKAKNVLKDYLIQDIKEKTDKGLEMKDYGGHGMNIALGLPWDFGMKEGIPSKTKGGKPITNLKQWIEQKGQPYYKQLEHASYELGKAGEGLFDQYFTTADVKDPRDAYTELPTKYASGLASLEKQEMLEGLKRKGKFMTRGFKDELEAQGIDWKEAYDTDRAEGGIMSLKKK